MTSLLHSALRLNKSERILLVEQIWESIARDQEAPELTAAQRNELDRRLARMRRSGPLGSPWSDVMKRFR